MNLKNIDLNKEKDFLSDTIKFYELKRFTPTLKQLAFNYEKNRKNITFEQNDFLDNSGIQYTIANKIYLIGLAEYKTNLTFAQFLYCAFWNPDCWMTKRNNSYNRYSFYWSSDRRFKNHKFRNPHKFRKNNNIKEKQICSEEEIKRSWREYKKINKDKAKFKGQRYGSYDKWRKSSLTRKERKYVRQKLRKEKECLLIKNFN